MADKNFFNLENERLIFSGHVQVIRDWGNEVKDAIESKSSKEDWDLIGHAVTIITNDEDDCSELLKNIATQTGLGFLEISCKEILEKFSSTEFAERIAKKTIVYLRPGNWLVELDQYKKLDSEEIEVDIAQDNICKAIRSFNPSQPVIYVVSVKNFDSLSERFRYYDLFNRRFVVQSLNYAEKGEMFISMIGPDVCDGSLLANYPKLGKLLDLEFKDKRRQQLIALALKRLSKKENRKVTFLDLVDMGARGSAELDGYPEKTSAQIEQIAVHEAGHALVAILDSKGKNIPEYATIIEGDDFHGVVVESYGYLQAKGHETTYEQFKHKVRVALAGRVAEHLVFGYEHIGTAAASSDLRTANRISYRMFAERGIAIETDTIEGVSANLLVVDEEPTQSQSAHVEELIRIFLSDQYKYVYSLLEEHKPTLDVISEALKTQRMLAQADLMKLVNC